VKGDRVLDTWAILAFFQGHGSAGAQVEKILNAALGSNRRVYLHGVNWTELYATIEGKVGDQAATETVAILDRLPIVLIGTEDLEVCRQAAWHKTAFDLTLGASFAAGLAAVKKARLVTGDPQFLPLAGDMTLEWLGDPALMAENSNI
jgi:hypothetical protein